MDLRQVWETGAYHRIARVLIQDSHRRVLLQKRSLKLSLYPGCWDVSAAGHVDSGMSYEAAARQELEEEIGVKDGKLEEVDYYLSRETHQGRKLNRFNKLYILRSSYTPDSLEEGEVSEVRWFSEQELRDLATKQPQNLSDGLQQALERLYDIRVS